MLLFPSKKVLSTLKVSPVIILSLVYVALAFGYSALGFLSGLPHGNGSEYTISFLIPEISGHILFAVVAVLPFLDLQLMLLASVIAVFIDTDHLLGIFTTLPYIGRPDHSILFMIVAASVLVYLSRRLNLSTSSQIKVAIVWYWLPSYPTCPLIFWQRTMSSVEGPFPFLYSTHSVPR